MSTALITGGTSGIGKAITSKFLANNCTVISADIEASSEKHQNFHHRFCDITKGKQVDDLFLWMLENTGLPDILVLNAGICMHEKLTEGDPEKWLHTLQVNVMGALRFIRAFVPNMEKNKRGKIVFISSVSSAKAYSYGGVYSASKAALNTIAETLRVETHPNLHVLLVKAGITDTAFFENHPAGSAENLETNCLLAEDIADDVWYAINKRPTAQIQTIVTRPANQSF